MSHIVTIQTQIRDPVAVRAACNRLRLDPPINGKHQLFSESIGGLGVQLRDWKYPLVCQTESGELRYDNFNGRWGHPDRLNEFVQSYAIENTKLVARRQGRSVTEQPLADGSVKLTISVGDGL